MKKYLVGISAGVALCVAGGALARGDSFAAPHAYAKSGAYIGVEGGYGFINTPEATYPKDFTTGGTIFPINGFSNISNYSTTTDKGDFVWGVHIGYAFKASDNMTLGVQVGYKDLGQ